MVRLLVAKAPQIVREVDYATGLCPSELWPSQSSAYDLLIEYVAEDGTADDDVVRLRSIESRSQHTVID